MHNQDVHQGENGVGEMSKQYCRKYMGGRWVDQW